MAELAKLPERRPRIGGERGPVREFLMFLLAGEPHALELRRIREILSPPPITEVPRAPHAIVGVCSVRGLLVTVLDLRRALALRQRSRGRRERILLASSRSGEGIGLLVDEEQKVVRLSESEIEAASVLGADVGAHVLGVGRPEKSAFVVLLDLDAILSE